MSDLTTEVKRLYRLGFAIHWLAPKSKRPIEMKWTSGDRKNLKELSETYKLGMNVGVRLGRASKVGEQFLGVIDCDVKSDKPLHLLEMQEKLESITKNLVNLTPIVKSGRGNGSQHVYVLTDQPARPKRLARSETIVKVLMPSAETPSKKERGALTEAQLKAGWRLRPAWEISLMGEGQQVVLPPSIHPDSGKPYEWFRKLRDADDIQTLAIEMSASIDEDKNDKKVIHDFKPVAVDLVGSSLSDETVDQIINGTGVEDRSGALLSISNRMLKAGFSDIEILSVLTDPDHYLGSAAYDHAKTSKRSRAAEWIRRFTLEKAKKETLAEEVFKAEVVETVMLSDEEAEAQREEFSPSVSDWMELIQRGSPDSGGGPKNTLKNVILILENAVGKDLFIRDEFSLSDFYGMTPPWRGKKGDEITDMDLIRIKTWLADNWRFEPSDDRVNQAVSSIADKNHFHPVKEYLNALPAWDGVPRLDTWLKRLLSAKAKEPYLSAVSRKTIVGMIARIMDPGCKFESMLILEGLQGKGKSRSLRALAGEWFTDATIDIHDKDSVLVMRSKWLIEAGELASVRKADVLAFKSFISRESDRIRVPYGKRMENFPRQCIFVGTTNEREYLNDPTGARRFWPVDVGDCHVEALSAERDQLFAEAVVAYDLGEPLWLEDAEMVEGAKEEQTERSIVDTWDDRFEDWIDQVSVDDTVISPRIDRSRFRTDDLFHASGPFAGEKVDFMNTRRAHALLRKKGYDNRNVRTPNTNQIRKYWMKRGVAAL